MRIALALLLFFATWLLWSGIYLPFLVVLGAVSCGVVLLLAWRIGFFDPDMYALDLLPRLPRFWAWLLREIVQSNLAVAKIILHPRLPISPCLVTIDARELPQASQATLANAITLTPGTLTTDIDHGRIEVHCLTRALADQVNSGESLRRARRLKES
jgi:multicomponent Na+:H+ antiporter subunit E